MIFILNFHGLGKPPARLAAGELRCWLDVSFFENVLRLVASRKDVLVTFDDGNASDYTIALPILSAHRMAAKFFIVADRIDRNGYLSRNEIESLVSVGMTIGIHGMHHCAWTGLGSMRLQEELVEARDRLEQIVGAHVREAACPFGRYNYRVVRALRNFGYNRIYTSDDGPAFADRLIQPRNTIRRAHVLSEIERALSYKPKGLRKCWRDLKLMIKRFR